MTYMSESDDKKGIIGAESPEKIVVGIGTGVAFFSWEITKLVLVVFQMLLSEIYKGFISLLAPSLVAFFGIELVFYADVVIPFKIVGCLLLAIGSMVLVATIPSYIFYLTQKSLSIGKVRDTGEHLTALVALTFFVIFCAIMIFAMTMGEKAYYFKFPALMFVQSHIGTLVGSFFIYLVTLIILTIIRFTVRVNFE